MLSVMSPLASVVRLNTFGKNITVNSGDTCSQSDIFSLSCSLKDVLEEYNCKQRRNIFLVGFLLVSVVRSKRVGKNVKCMLVNTEDTFSSSGPLYFQLFIHKRFGIIKNLYS